MVAGTVQKKLSCLGVGCDALEERKGITDAVGYMCCEIWRGKHWVYRDNLLKEGWHDTCKREVRCLLWEMGK